MLTSNVWEMGEAHSAYTGAAGCIFVVCSVVEYASHEDMKSALKKLDGAELNGRKLKLTEDSRSGKKRR